MRLALVVLLIAMLSSCANIVPPSGGDRDTTRPVWLSVSPADSQLNTRVSKIELQFDEYVELADASKEVTIAPLLPIPLTITSTPRQVKVVIPDTLLQDNTTYRITFNNAIKDLNEGNVFSGYNYIFSTGGYFDSLTLSGNIYNAISGGKDSAATILLYSASLPDSSIIRERPSYVTRADALGAFRFEGLPNRDFRIYAVTDGNGNYTYDGGDELVAFSNTTVNPGDSLMRPIVLRLFKEATADTSAAQPATSKRDRIAAIQVQQGDEDQEPSDPDQFTYSVGVDTSNVTKRTTELTQPISITFSRPVIQTAANRVYLSFDSSGIDTEVPFTLAKDATNPAGLLINTRWKPDAVYTLRLLKGFAKDSAGTDVMPGKYIFRTKRDEDYAKLQVHLPTEWGSGGHVLFIMKGNDTFYHKTVRDTILRFDRMQPADYSMRIVYDDDRNGTWTTGDLFLRRQPELVVPHTTVITLKPGWENQVDFLPPPPPDTTGGSLLNKKPRFNSSPATREEEK